MSKLSEKAVVDQVCDFACLHRLFPVSQSSYGPGNSTKTALLKVKSDILRSIDRYELTLLILLDLSAAFDTVDHGLLLQVLENDFGLFEDVKAWFLSYLTGRQQKVQIKSSMSHASDLTCSVTQGICIGPVLFIMYISKLFRVVNKHLPSCHTYADDTQLYLSFRPDDTDSAISAMEECISSVSCWMIHSKHKVNDAKTEFLMIGSSKML